MDSENAIVQTLYDFEASFGDELSFKAGDILQVLYRIDQDWVHARQLIKQDSDFDLLTGNVPSNYYRVLKVPENLFERKTQQRLYLAKHNFYYSEVGDLDFIKGQLIVSHNNVDQNWCFGSYMNDSSRTGVFPLSHVSKVYLSGFVDDSLENAQAADSNRNSDSSGTDAASLSTISHKNSTHNNTQPNTQEISGRQAKVIDDFDPDTINYDSSEYKYLRVYVGDYVLVRARIDDNWIEVESFKGDKGLIPAKYIEYKDEQPTAGASDLPILNRTQRRYTLLNSDTSSENLINIDTSTTPNQQAFEPNGVSPQESNHFEAQVTGYVASSQIESSNASISPYSSMSLNASDQASSSASMQRTFCRVLYDFHPLGDKEVGCLKDEYLEITSMYILSDWMNVRNIHGKHGLVPANYVSMLDNQEGQVAQKLFEENDKKLVDRSLDPLVKEVKRSVQKEIIKPPKARLHELHVSKDERSKMSETLKESIERNRRLGNSPPSQPPQDATDTRQATGSEQFKEPYKPPIPPKPRIVKLASSQNQLLTIDEQNLDRNMSNSNSSLSDKSSSEPGNVRMMVSNFNGVGAETQPDLGKRSSLADIGVNRRVVRPNKPFYNPELLAKIKSLESIIEKQKSEQENVFKGLKPVPEDKRPIENDSKLENLQRDLSDMKNLFVETARNPELALRQIGNGNELIKSNEASPKSDSDAYRESGGEGRLSSASSSDSVNKKQSSREKKIKQRRYAVQELLDTETKMCQELSSAYELFGTDENGPVRFRKEIMNEIKPIIEVSRGLIELLQAEISKKKPLISLDNEISEPDTFEIGACLTTKSEEMKKVYAKYIRDHASLDNTLKNYESDPVLKEYIRNKFGKSETDLNAKLSNVFIKPVQRIFKYPLLISKLVENTEKDHCDYEGLIEASIVFKNMLDYINEYKRRQDITSKYLDRTKGQKTGTLTKTLKTFAKPNTVRKKVTRLSMDVSFFLGFSNQQVYDENFERIEILYRKVEKVLKFVKEYVEQNSYDLRELLECEMRLFYSLKSLFDVDAQAFNTLYDAAVVRFQSLYPKYNDAVSGRILKPLNQLLRMLHGPNMLIAKRKDKKLDYESVLSESKANDMPNNDKRLETTKKDYVALNDQLVEDLPQLIENTVKVLGKVADIFMVITSSFVSEVNESLKKSVAESGIYNLDLTDHHAKAVAESMNNLKQHLNQQLAIFAPEKIKKQQTQMQKQFLKSKYQPNELYVSTENYEGDEAECQLSVSANDVLVLLKPFDPVGNQNIWYVFNGEMRGFLPAKILKSISQTDQTSEAKSSSREAYERMRHMSVINFDQLDPNRTPDRGLARSASVLEQVSPALREMDSGNHEKCRALYNCQPLATNGIQLKKDQFYKVIDKCDKRGNPDWWLLESCSISNETKRREIGYAPRNYVELIAPQYQNDIQF